MKHSSSLTESRSTHTIFGALCSAFGLLGALPLSCLLAQPRPAHSLLLLPDSIRANRRLDMASRVQPWSH